MKNYFAENFTDLLRIKNLSQKSFAETLGVQASTVNQWAKGKREPSFDLLIQICEALDTEPSELLGYKKAISRR